MNLNWLPYSSNTRCGTSRTVWAGFGVKIDDDDDGAAGPLEEEFDVVVIVCASVVPELGS